MSTEETSVAIASDITEEEVRNDVMNFANVLFERGMTDDPLGIARAGRTAISKIHG